MSHSKDFRHLPKDTRPVGSYKVLTDLGIDTILRDPKVISDKSIRKNKIKDDDYEIFSIRYWPGDSLFDHLTFALKYETFDLLVFNHIFKHINKTELVEFIQENPKGIYVRKIWFLYEWLRETKLELADAPMCNATKLIDEKKYFTIKGELSKRHRVINNLIGTNKICPVIERTEYLEHAAKKDIQLFTEDIIKSTPESLMVRASSFLLLADTKATFEIEGERAPQNKLERWAESVTQAGRYELTLDEIIRLHGILLRDNRFVHLGLRKDEVFLGQRDSHGHALPEFIGAKASDLTELMNAWVELEAKIRKTDLHPIIQAVAIAFAFIYIHPLEDGNGRLHRYLIHHVLADRGLTPMGIIFPVSAVIMRRIDDYRKVLMGHSRPLMKMIDWNSNAKGNVDVNNDTKDLYRFFNCTKASEFIFECVFETIEDVLPEELKFIKGFDHAFTEIAEIFEMPDNMISLLINLIKSNDFKLSKNKRNKLFKQLTDQEVRDIEEIVQDAFLE